MKQLGEADVIRIMREEWDKKVRGLSEEVNLVLNTDVNKDGDTTTIVSPELKLHHKGSGILYTVNSVGPRDVILRTPEGESFIVDKEELESEYELA